MSLLICAINANSTTVCTDDRAGLYDSSGQFTVTREGVSKMIQVSPTTIFAFVGAISIGEQVKAHVQSLANYGFNLIAESLPSIARELMRDAIAPDSHNEPRLAMLLTGWDEAAQRLRAVCWHSTDDFTPREAPPNIDARLVMAHGPQAHDRALDLLQQGVTIQETFTQLAAKYPQIGSRTETRTVALMVRVNTDGESGTVGSAAPSWTPIAGVTPLIANDAVHSGTKSIKFANTAGANSLSVQSVSVTGGQVYVVEGWIKTDAITAFTTHGAYLNVAVGGGVTGFTIITKFGAADAGSSTTPTIGIRADGAAHPFTLVQCYFIPNTSGFVTVGLQAISLNAANVWFDDVKVYPHGFGGGAYSALTASTGYYMYMRIDNATGKLQFVNGNPPGTSPSDSLALSCGFDGFISVPPKKITTPASGGTGSDTGGGSGTCPEFDALVTVRRYSDAGVLIFEGDIRAGEVSHGNESDEAGPDGETFKRGDFMKGYSFKQQADVYRAVQQVQHVPCAGWMRIDGIRFTACEMVFDSGEWLPAWKVPGAVQDSSVGIKVLIQVEADWDDEHNYYVNTNAETPRLIHNAIILPC
ncbi:MAG TPA: hypothetical protein VGK36_20380 [Candidatus Angelobacter sp.]|jgi:hypothetical protein